MLSACESCVNHVTGNGHPTGPHRHNWHAAFLHLRHLPREVTAFEIEVFSQFSAEEARIVLIGRIAPTRTEGINLSGIFRFPVERYVDKILASAAAKTTTAGNA